MSVASLKVSVLTSVLSVYIYLHRSGQIIYLGMFSFFTFECQVCQILVCISCQVCLT